MFKTMNRRPIRVLLVGDTPDQHRRIPLGLHNRDGLELVGQADSGIEAARMARTLGPDVIILDHDHDLADLTDREVLRRIREASPQSNIVITAATESAERAWFEDHTEGYVLRDANLAELLDLVGSMGAEPSDRAVLNLPRRLASVRLARKFVRRKLRDWDATAVEEDACLVVSELAANAITHANSTCRTTLSVTSSTLRIEVQDCGTGAPEVQPPSTSEDHGRGLLIVAALSAAWGQKSVRGEGKIVWAELALPAPVS